MPLSIRREEEKMDEEIAIFKVVGEIEELHT